MNAAQREAPFPEFRLGSQTLVAPHLAELVESVSGELEQKSLPYSHHPKRTGAQVEAPIATAPPNVAAMARLKKEPASPIQRARPAMTIAPMMIACAVGP